MTKFGPVTVDDVLDLETSGRSQTEIAATLVDWAERTEEEGPDGYSPASLLITAAEHLDMAGVDGADELLDRAEHAAGHDQTDVFVARIEHALTHGDLETALAIEKAARRNPTRHYHSYERVADALDTHDQHQLAERWTNIGLRRLESNPEADLELDHLLIVRYRIRRRRGAKPDGYDEEAELIIAEAQDSDG